MLSTWTPNSWQTKSIVQQPTYEDPAQLEAVLSQLRKLPPLVTSWEVDNLQKQLESVTEARRGYFRAATAPRLSTVANRSQ